MGWWGWVGLGWGLGEKDIHKCHLVDVGVLEVGLVE